MDRPAMQDLEEVRRIVLLGLRGHEARVFLFGSRATGEARRTSDVDVAILPVDRLPRGLLSEIREALEDSRVPQTVDLVDLTRANAAFRERVEREGVRWN